MKHLESLFTALTNLGVPVTASLLITANEGEAMIIQARYGTRLDIFQETPEGDLKLIYTTTL